MYSMSLSKQISLGFALMVAAMLVMGVVALTNMSSATHNSKKLNDEYIAEVEMVSSLERNFAKVRIPTVKLIGG